MVSEVVRASFGGPPAIAAFVPGRAGSGAQRFAPAHDRLLLDHDPIGSRSGARRAWTLQAGRDTVSLTDLLPQAAFAAQLMSQEDPGTRAHIERFAGAAAAYVAAEQRPGRGAPGAALSIEI